MIADDFIYLSILFFRKLFYFLSYSAHLVRFYCLVSPNTGPIGPLVMFL